MLFYTLTYKRQVLEIEIHFLTLGEIQYMLTSKKEKGGGSSTKTEMERRALSSALGS
jgi:hypothetical protein